MDNHFQEFLRLTYSTYAENPKSLQLFSKNFSTSGILPKNLKLLPLFGKKSATSGIFPEFPKSFRFTQKKVARQYIRRKSATVHPFCKKSATSGILPKILKTFSLFRTFFKKSFSGILRQTGHRHFNNTLCANSPNSPNLPSTGVISKTTPRCVAAFGKNSEKHHLPPLTIAITPLFCNTLFQLFFKNFCLSTADYHFLPRKGHTCSKNFSKKTPHC